MTAQAMAVAMKGAVHGVASTVVTTPLRNAPSGPSFAAADWTEPLPKKPGIGTSHTPSRLSAIANTTAAIVTLNAVLPNWPPQERPIVAASKPSSRNTDDDAGREPEIEHERMRAALAGLLDEAHHLEADDGQHARHQVEDQAADERQRDVVRERTAGRRFENDAIQARTDRRSG